MFVILIMLCFWLPHSPSFGAEFESSCSSFLIQENKPTVFAANWDGELSVFKIDVESLGLDLQLADQLFRESGSKLFEANPILETVEIPSRKLRYSDIPEASRKVLSETYGPPPYVMFRSRYIVGEAPKRLQQVKQQEMSAYLERYRIFAAEAERIFNWVRSHKPIYRGIPVKAAIVMDKVRFRIPQRQETINAKGYWFQSGDFEFRIYFEDSFRLHNGKYVLVDPH